MERYPQATDGSKIRIRALMKDHVIDLLDNVTIPSLLGTFIISLSDIKQYKTVCHIVVVFFEDIFKSGHSKI